MSTFVHILKYNVFAVRSVCSDVHRIPHLRTYARRLTSAQALKMILKRHKLLPDEFEAKYYLTVWRKRIGDNIYRNLKLIKFLASIFENEIDRSISLHMGERTILQDVPHPIHFLRDPFLSAMEGYRQSSLKFTQRSLNILIG